MTTTLAAANPTLLDIMRTRGPSGEYLPVVEALAQQNGLVRDAVWKEGNSETGNTFSSRTAIPSVAARRFNQGVAASKSRRDQVTESVAMVEGRSQVDAELAELGGKRAEFRASEDDGFVQSMNNELERLAFYGTVASNPEEFNGLAPRLDSTTDPYGQQIVLCDSDASGNDQTSMWLVCWGDKGVYMFYPKGSTSGGLKMHDMGVQMVADGDGNRYRAYESVWDWKAGICVEDGKQLVRIANIDAVKIAAGTSPLIEAMITAYHQIGNPNMGRLAWYCNRALETYLHLQALDKVINSTLSIEKDLVNGKPVVTFLGIPIRRSDEILSSESVVS